MEKVKKFKKFYLEITSVCNLACSFCPPTIRARQFVSPEDFAMRLDQIKPHTDYINLHVKGEPLLHPKIGELLDISAEKGFKVNITTNGTLIEKRREQLLNKPAIRQMNFSLHSFDDNNLPDREGYMQKIIDFVKEQTKATDMIVSFRLWNLSQDNRTNAEIKRNRALLAMIEKAFDLDYQIEERVEPGGGIQIAERVYINQDYEFKWPSLDEEEDDGKGFCYGLRNQAAILSNGTVVPCCLDGEGVIDLGNIYKDSFSDIIKMERAQNLVDGFSRREAVEELCRKCGFRQRFGK
ncbi:MAG TPA: radical SAM protein [Candidatus Pseudogracilibacillus intestinigallinarum]|uniref:Radical SAM protein n=1 Tax=Candidatus Pseudogracilibacillus intestinigallinarum TaxID=2838742 RepID=A0A9D1TKV5_9BACI|nr:radical SAM protein [Candidatus Pseudogracilibacillus intestinigallinarum]